MANMLRSAASWLADQLQVHASETVVYRRGDNAVTLTASFGSQLLRTTDSRGVTKVERTDRDFILPAADLILGGEPTEPMAGDFVDVTIDDVTERFEVMSLPAQESPWRYSDPHKKLIRVHAKYLGVISDPEPIADEVGDYILIEDDD